MLSGFELRRLPHHFCDVLVLGSGVAGLRAALAAAEGGADVMVVAKAELAETNTRYAQGGIATVTEPADSLASHARDTLEAARGLAKPEIVELVVAQAGARTRELLDWGARFDRQGDELALTREGGHSFARIIHAGGDATGAEVQRVLQERALASERIRFLTRAFVVDLVDAESGGIGGAIAVQAGNQAQVLHAGATILATGGAGALYRETTNSHVASGDGVAMAYRAGAVVRDFEFIQFHPTVLYIAGAARTLVSEAVRGEGAYLRDKHGERFMLGAHPDAELAPRDVVARAIVRRLAETGGSAVYLDCRHLDPARIAARFPSIAEAVARFSLNLATDLIPVHPAAHYTIGGVITDATGASTTPYLFAAGEAASTGLHGANRLGSNSLLEAMVFGKLAGEHAAMKALERPQTSLVACAARRPQNRADRPLDLRDLANSLRFLLWRHAGVERDGAGLKEGLSELRRWESYAMTEDFSETQGWEVQNQLLLGRLVMQAALMRQETRGAHSRRDYPQTDALARHSLQSVGEFGVESCTLAAEKVEAKP